jgi:hypothetical protein
VILIAGPGNRASAVCGLGAQIVRKEMVRMTHKLSVVCTFSVVLAGCSSVNVVKNPSAGDNGIRYYRPKPYLLVTPADETGRMVKLEILQLPDYCEEYSIHPRGKKPPGVQLQDGWNLVGVGGAGPAPPPAGAPPAPPPVAKLPDAVLAASNVPIGLYESVFDYSGPVKYLKGWRYVGFSPFGSSGPPNGTDQAGTAAAARGCPPCASAGSVIQGPLYGIVFFNGAMTFRPIDEIGNNMMEPQYVKPLAPASTGGTDPLPTKPSSGSGTQPIPTRPAPPAPGPSSFRTPKAYSVQFDGGLAQTSSSRQTSGASGRNSSRTTTTATKAVDPKSLEALEAEVFKKLNMSPPKNVNGSSTSKLGSSATTASSTSGSAFGSAVPSTYKVSGGSPVPDLTPVAPMAPIN